MSNVTVSNVTVDSLATNWTVVMEFTDLSVVKKENVKFYEIQDAIFELRNAYSDRPAIERITVR